MDKSYEVAPEPMSAPTGAREIASEDGARVDKIKAALEARRKMMIVAALDRGTVSIDGDYLRVVYAPEDSRCKNEIEARAGRIAIEDACDQVLGRRLTLWASIAGQPEVGGGPRRKERIKDTAEDNPKLRALVDKFHGEIIEVIKPEK
jgi:hypothetical protein